MEVEKRTEGSGVSCCNVKKGARLSKMCVREHGCFHERQNKRCNAVTVSHLEPHEKMLAWCAVRCTVHLIMVGSDMESFVDLAWKSERQHPLRLEPICFQHCFELDSCATSAHNGGPSASAPPSSSSRKDSHAQSHAFPRHSSRSPGRGRGQPIPASGRQ